MPPEVERIVAGFVAAFHVEREFYKRKRKARRPERLRPAAPPPWLGLDADGRATPTGRASP